MCVHVRTQDCLHECRCPNKTEASDLLDLELHMVESQTGSWPLLLSSSMCYLCIEEGFLIGQDAVARKLAGGSCQGQVIFLCFESHCFTFSPCTAHTQLSVNPICPVLLPRLTKGHITQGAFYLALKKNEIMTLQENGRNWKLLRQAKPACCGQINAFSSAEPRFKV